MSHITEQAEELRQKAIALLLQEREAIDQKLAQFGFAGAASKEVRRSCSVCGAPDHNARRCPKRDTAEKTED
jgi:hypothetical protein